MSKNNKKSKLFQIKAFHQIIPKRNNFIYSVLSLTYDEITQKIKDSIYWPTNQIELGFNKYHKQNNYKNKTLMRNQNSFDNLFFKGKKQKENKIFNNNRIIKHNYSVKVMKPKIYNRCIGYNLKSIDIDLNRENIIKENYLSINKNNRINKKRTSKSININKRKKDCFNKTKNIKHKCEYFNQEQLKNINNKYDINNKDNNKFLNKTNKTNPNSLIYKNNLFIKKKNKIKKLNENRKTKLDLNLNNNNKKNYNIVKKREKKKLRFDINDNKKNNL